MTHYGKFFGINTNSLSSFRKKNPNNTRYQMLANLCSQGKDSGQDKPTKPPDPISIIFRDDYDIRKVDREVRNFFKYEETTLPELQDRMIKCRQELETVATVKGYESLSNEVRNLAQKIQDIDNKVRFNEYEQQAIPLINQYKEHIKPQEVININKIDKEKSIPMTEEDRLRINIITSYLRLASQYIELDWINEIKLSDCGEYCEGCGMDIGDIVIAQDGSRTCYECGVVKYVSRISEILETSSGVTNDKEYCDESNFKKAFKRFVCEQDISYDINAVVDNLDRLFLSEGYQPASYYRNLPVTNGWKKEGTNLQLLVHGLKKIGRNDLYEDYNIIGCHLWGWNIPDASYLEDIIMSDYRETQDVYDSMDKKTRGRSSCLSTQLRLFKQLQLRGFECEITDFKVPIQHETLRKQERLWQMMCEGCKNPSIYYIGSSNT